MLKISNNQLKSSKIENVEKYEDKFLSFSLVYLWIINCFFFFLRIFKFVVLFEKYENYFRWKKEVKFNYFFSI